MGFSAKSHTSNVELCCAAYSTCTSLSYCSSEKFEPIEVPRPSPPKVKREIPPYNGFGSEEDSLASCLNLIPKPPRRCVHCHRFTAMEVIHQWVPSMQGFHEIYGEGSSWAGEQCATVCGPSRHHPAHRHGQTVHCLLPSL